MQILNEPVLPCCHGNTCRAASKGDDGNSRVQHQSGENRNLVSRNCRRHRFLFKNGVWHQRNCWYAVYRCWNPVAGHRERSIAK